MENEKTYLIGLLMEKQANLKMLEYIFEDNPKISERKMNAILDEKLRLEKDIETIKRVLEELENKK